ncbi:hypothetical protein ACQCLI_32160 (plasmid) [Pseudomonas nitroreducens]|uniref:hypothetical protein n=1 Tax=Pseudomonas nitroreducens TaxID=46680 RepID=UPI0003760BD4|nr:hypothetical protein [Pseudomonas nitroreducens]
MFYKAVEAAFQAGKVRVGLPALGHTGGITIEANGLIGLKSVFLSRAERHKLAELCKSDALAAKAGEPK